MKDVIGRRLYHFFAFCQQHRLEYVYGLRDTCHFNAVAVFVEKIERNVIRQYSGLKPFGYVLKNETCNHIKRLQVFLFLLTASVLGGAAEKPQQL